MTRTIFRNILLVGLSVFVLCVLLFFALQYTGSRDDAAQALAQESLYTEQGIRTGGEAFLEGLDDSSRIAWISAEGKVLYSSSADTEEGNLTELLEIREAFSEGEGRSIRKTAEGRTIMYYARLCEDGTVIRLGRQLKSLGDALMEVSPVFWLLVLVLLISSVLAFRAASKIVRPINAIDLEDPERSAYPEIRPLLDKIIEQKLTIQEEAAQREQMRREFTANVSHELKTPLTSISGFAELMAQGIVSQDKIQEFSGDIYRESKRLMALIDDIIALSKLDEEAVGPGQKAIDLYKLSLEVKDALRFPAEQKQVQIEVSGDHTSISGVYHLLYEMVYNLCDNAVKYNYEGGSVKIRIQETEQEVRLSVKDTGIGIPEEHQKRVFERFYRVDKSHSREMGGTGLGLSIVKHGAQYHHAQIEMESKQGEGTSITLVFPV